MKTKVRVVHYLNQFFAGIGGEAQAGHPVSSRPGPVGPGVLLQQLLGEEGEVVQTLYCGDNLFAEKTEESARELLRLVSESRPDVFVAGPAFNAGRYGTACAFLCRRVQEELKIPAITGLFRENPGVEMCRALIPIVPCSETATGMSTAMDRIAGLTLKLGRGEELGTPEEEGCMPRGQRRNEFSPQTGAQRAIAMLLRKVKGGDYTSEIPVPDFGEVTPAPALSDTSGIKVAVVTSGGLVPRGNPDGIESRRATHWSKYSIAGLDGLDPSMWTCVHGGFDSQYIQRCPDRVVPLDALREMEREGVIGSVHEYVYTTVGAGAPVSRARAFGQEIAAELKAAGVDAVIFTST